MSRVHRELLTRHQPIARDHWLTLDHAEIAHDVANAVEVRLEIGRINVPLPPDSASIEDDAPVSGGVGDRAGRRRTGCPPDGRARRSAACRAAPTSRLPGRPQGCRSARIPHMARESRPDRRRGSRCGTGLGDHLGQERMNQDLRDRAVSPSRCRPVQVQTVDRREEARRF